MTVINIIELTKTAPMFRVVSIISVVLIPLSLFAAFWFIPNHEKISNTFTVVMIVSFIVAVVCASISDDDRFRVPTGECQYEILIDDSVTFSEVNDKYNIIEQRGEIFLVEEKEDEH